MKLTFDSDIIGLTKENAKQKIIPYINELLTNLIDFKCENIRITTNIKILANKQVEAFFNIEEIDNITKKKK